MSRQLSGQTSRYGVSGLTMNSGSLTTSMVIIHSYSAADSFDEAMLQDSNGDVIGEATSKRQRRATIEGVIISSSSPPTEQNAIDNTAFLAALVGNVLVTISDTTTSASSWLEGDWNYKGHTLASRLGEYQTFTMQLSRTEIGSTMAALTPR